MQRRHVEQAKQSQEQRENDPAATHDDYAPIVADTLAALDRIVPEGARVLVVSRGDAALTRLAQRETWHFPCLEDGGWVGYNPPDANWAIEQVERERERGAQFLAFPASAFWWLETYRTFAAHLDDHYAVAAEHQRRYVIYDLREPIVPVERDAHRNGKSESESGQAAPPRSLMDTADELLGYGGHHRTALRPIYEGADDVFPHFAVAADGYELTDSAGRTFIDWVGGGGPMLLGYRHPAVEEAIRAQFAAGPTLTLMHPVEVEVAALLKDMVPCAEMVTFGKNGSDALAGALRVARAATGREVIFQHGVHGFHEWFTCIQPGVLGIPKVLRALVQPFPYNDLDALAEMFERHSGEVAAIVMEPMTFELPAPGYLDGVIELAHSHGALVVFDEMVTGLRLANGGAQELFGVTPDLACFGNGLANGMPLSALVGARRYMELLPRVAYGMTFRGETLSLAAARAVLQHVKDDPVAPHLERIGGQLRRGFAAACEQAGVRARLLGHESRMAFAFEDDAGIEAQQAQAIFLEQCAQEGILTNGSLMPSLAHDGKAVVRTMAAFRSAARRVGGVVASGRGAFSESMDAGFGETGGRGCFDSVQTDPGKLVVHGWMLLADGPPEIVEAVGDGGDPVAVASRVPRPDLAEAFPSVPGAGTGGFSLSVPAAEFAPDGDYAFTLRARHGDREPFTCRVVRRQAEHRGVEHYPTRDADGVLHL